MILAWHDGGAKERELPADRGVETGRGVRLLGHGAVEAHHADLAVHGRSLQRLSLSDHGSGGLVDPIRPRSARERFELLDNVLLAEVHDCVAPHLLAQCQPFFDAVDSDHRRTQGVRIGHPGQSHRA